VEYLIELTAQGDDPLGDPLLRLADASGLEVARDDDGGAGTDSALSYTPSETGRHFVIADMPFGLDTGGYLVSLRQSPDAGTPGADVLIGGSASDRLEGLDGDDVLRGEAGDDTLLGGDGNDTLDGGDGNDTIRGGATGADRRDVIFAGAGDDDVDGGHGNDQLNGGSGNDRLAGGFGVDEVRGNAGDDVMTGSAFSDLIFGGPGFDFVNGGFGFDRVNGGDDADRFFHTGDAGHGSDWIQDYDAAEGDVLLYGGQAQPDQFRVITTETRNAGQAGVEEAFVVHTQTGQILWALVDGGGQDAINLSLGGQLVDLFG
jgi:Ca2+-binding RTX toxin-like protein